MCKRNKIIYFETGNGDSSIVQLYDDNSEEYTNVLFDIGKNNSSILNEINKIIIHGIVITHVDEDHIYGIIQLLKNEEFKKKNDLQFIVFNEYNESLISYRQGNILMNIIKSNYSEVLLVNSYGDDYEFINSVLKYPIKFLSIEKRDLLADLKMKKDIILLTFLAPNYSNLKNLMGEWKKNNEGLKGKTGEITNQSSIVCLIEYKDTKILMTGDQNINSIHAILKNKKRNWNIDKIDCIKISHHGSKQSNEGLVELAKVFDCRKMFIMSYHATDPADVIKELDECDITIYKMDEGYEIIEL